MRILSVLKDLLQQQRILSNSLQRLDQVTLEVEQVTFRSIFRFLSSKAISAENEKMKRVVLPRGLVGYEVCFSSALEVVRSLQLDGHNTRSTSSGSQQSARSDNPHPVPAPVCPQRLAMRSAILH